MKRQTDLDLCYQILTLEFRIKTTKNWIKDCYENLAIHADQLLLFLGEYYTRKELFEKLRKYEKMLKELETNRLETIKKLNERG